MDAVFGYQPLVVILKIGEDEYILPFRVLVAVIGSMIEITTNFERGSVRTS